MKEFTLFERWLIGVNVAVSTILLCMGGDYTWLAWMGYISSISNTVCVVLVAKQKLSNYYWGILGVVTYAIVAYVAGNTGEWLHHVFFYLPANCIGWWMWMKRKSIYSDVDVDSKLMSAETAAIVYGVTIGLVISFAKIISLPSLQMDLYGKVFDYGFDKYLIDSLTSILSMVAMILMCFCYTEQWVLWIVIDVASIILWCYTFDPMMIVMWGTMTVNAVYGYIKWRKQAIWSVKNRKAEYK